MSDEQPEEEPKLIIDEDWKTQVQREKEQLKQAQSQPEQEADAEAEDGDGDGDGDGDKTSPPSGEQTTDAVESPPAEQSVEEETEDSAPLPPATLTFLITSLATQALASLGQLPGEDGQPLPVNKEHARHFIDLLGVLEEKTKGNLDAQEEKFLSETLHQMRMMFVSQS